MVERTQPWAQNDMVGGMVGLCVGYREEQTSGLVRRQESKG